MSTPEQPEVIEADAVDAEPPGTELATRDETAPVVRREHAERELEVYNSLHAARDWPQLMSLADGIFRSRMAPSTLRSVEAVAVIMIAGNELGMGPMEALQNLHAINNRIGMDATKMRARVYERIPGADIEVVEATPARCTLIGTRPGKTPVEVTYTIQDAQTAGLAGKDNYKNHPADMLMARATSRLVRRQFPDALGGAMYTPDELESIGPPPNPQPDQDPSAPTARTRGQRAAAPAMKQVAQDAAGRWWPLAKAQWPDEDDKALVGRFRAYTDASVGYEVGGPTAWTPEIAAAVNAALDASDDPRPPEPDGAE